MDSIPVGFTLAYPEQSMWMERHRCYAFIMRELFSGPPSGNYRYLKEFESGDSADIDAWEMAVEYVKRAGGGWTAEQPGIFIKDSASAKRQAEAESQGQEQLPAVLSVHDE